jgi:hypothetical protein
MVEQPPTKVTRQIEASKNFSIVPPVFLSVVKHHYIATPMALTQTKEIMFHQSVRRLRWFD